MTSLMTTTSTNTDLNNAPAASDIQHRLDTKGLICPEPVMMLHKVIRKAEGGEVIEIFATDPASSRDIPNFCRHLGHELLLSETVDKEEIAELADSAESTAEDDEVTQYNVVYRYLVKKKQQ